MKLNIITIVGLVFYGLFFGFIAGFCIRDLFLISDISKTGEIKLDGFIKYECREKPKLLALPDAKGEKI